MENITHTELYIFGFGVLILLFIILLLLFLKFQVGSYYRRLWEIENNTKNIVFNIRRIIEVLEGKLDSIDKNTHGIKYVIKENSVLSSKDVEDIKMNLENICKKLDKLN